MVMRTSLCFLSGVAFTLLAGATHAQGQKPYPGTTPVDSLTADPVQGGAMSEYVESSGNASAAPPGSAVDTSRTHEEETREIRDGGHTRVPSPQAVVSGGDPIDTSDMPPPVPADELAEQSKNGVRWLCGGIGQHEAAYMKKEAPRYDMMLTFATRNGAYMADVEVEVVDRNGRPVLQTLCDAPIMLVDLPEHGAYRISAEAESYTVSRNVSVSNVRGGYRNIVMTWPLGVAGMQQDLTSVQRDGRSTPLREGSNTSSY